MPSSRRLQLGGLVALAAVSALALHAMGSGDLAAPPVHSWLALDGWYERLGPATALVAVVRLVTVGASAWLAIAAALQLVALTCGGASLRGLADAMSPHFLRSLACGAASLSVTAGLAMPAAAGPPENPAGTAVMVPLDVTPTTSTLPPQPPPTTTMLAPTTTAGPTATTTTAPIGPPAAQTAPPAPAAPAVPARPNVPAADEVVVAPGDSFWSIAVDEADGRQVTTYWRAMIEANRDRLVDPSNPDLLYPDQVLRLP
jgi:LysM domain